MMIVVEEVMMVEIVMVVMVPALTTIGLELGVLIIGASVRSRGEVNSSEYTKESLWGGEGERVERGIMVTELIQDIYIRENSSTPYIGLTSVLKWRHKPPTFISWRKHTLAYSNRYFWPISTQKYFQHVKNS